MEPGDVQQLVEDQAVELRLTRAKTGISKEIWVP